MNSLEIKHALLSYFRFKRQWLCASECMNNDIMVITNKDIIEVEVKINKYDLWKGEAKKYKHKIMLNCNSSYYPYPNRFYICVPEELKEEAIKWTETINKKYGIMICKKRTYFPYLIYIFKRASMLHNKQNKYLEKRIMKRVCTENINLIGRLLRESNNSRK